MRGRKFLPLLAAALVGVLTLAIAGTGSAQSDVMAAPAAEQAPAPYKVALVTDIGGLDDRSFNFLANKGLQAREEGARRRGPRLHLEVERATTCRTSPARCGTASNLVIGVGFLMADAVAQVAKRFPKTNFAIIDNSGVAAELKGKPTNVRGFLFKEQEAGYLVGYLAALAAKNRPNSAGLLAAIGGLKIPPVDRFIAGTTRARRRRGRPSRSSTATPRTSSTRRSARKPRSTTSQTAPPSSSRSRASAASASCPRRRRRPSGGSASTPTRATSARTS